MNKVTLKFLIRARQSTYASGMKPKIINGGNVYIIQNGNLEYRDTYFDQHQFFQGQEVLFKDKKPIWSMSYRGAATDDAIPGEVFDILQKFIKNYANSVRLGNSFEKVEGKFRYECKANGHLDEFTGEEKIYQNGILAHWMKYFGGKIN